MTIQLFTLFALTSAATAIPTRQQRASTCSHDSDITHYWGNFSPYYGPSSIPAPPPHCQVDFVQVLSRHGSRFPETAKTDAYKSFVSRLQFSIKDRSPSDLKEYAFLKDYQFELGAERLTSYGEIEMEESGKTFRKYYSHLLQNNDPVQGFVRASDINTAGRVYKSGEFFVKGGDISHNPFVFMIEAKDISNPLWNYMCPAFSLPPNSNVATEAMETFKKTWVPKITARLNENLNPFVFNDADTVSLMEMCPFTTNAASSFGDELKVSPFCKLFSLDEWKNYEYLRTLYIQYGFGSSNPLGATRGSPWVQELIARMTNRPIVDNTHYGGVNMTLDSNPVTFPLGKKVYLDFTHETDLVSIYAALGLYPEAKGAIRTSERVCAEKAGGYTASQVVPFGARMYIEKMYCGSTGAYGRTEERVRIIVNDRVMNLPGCRGDKHGTCRLDKWLGTQKFALKGGLWKQCLH